MFGGAAPPQITGTDESEHYDPAPHTSACVNIQLPFFLFLFLFFLTSWIWRTNSGSSPV